MKPVYQTLFGPDNGNCFTACLASILEVPLESVPNFHAMYEGEGYMSHVIPWLADRGYSMIVIRATNVNGSAVMLGTQGMYVIAGYMSPNHPDTKHAVVCKVDQSHKHNLRVVHDPAGDKGQPVRDQDGPNYIIIVTPIQQSKYGSWVKNLKEIRVAKEYSGHPDLMCDIEPDVRPFGWKAKKLTLTPKDDDDDWDTLDLFQAEQGDDDEV